jgi:hypothetical protein
MATFRETGSMRSLRGGAIKYSPLQNSLCVAMYTERAA